MKKKKAYAIGTFALLIFLILTALLCFNQFNKNVFFSNDNTQINTSKVVSYTVVDNQGKSLEYESGNEKFDTINSVLSSAQVYHDKSNLYIINNETTERLVLKGKHNEKVEFIPFYEKQPDGTTILILKDYCEGKSTNYLLDNHDYLVTNITETEYNLIFG